MPQILSHQPDRDKGGDQGRLTKLRLLDSLSPPFRRHVHHGGLPRVHAHDTRRTCGSLLATLDVHPRIAMAILRHSRIALTMEIYTQVPDKVTRDALRRLSDWLDHDEDQATRRAHEPLLRPALLYFAAVRGM